LHTIAHGLKFNKTTHMPMHTTIRKKIQLNHALPDPSAISENEIQQAVDFLQKLFYRNRILLVFQESAVDFKKRYAFIRDFFLDLQLPNHPEEMYFCFMYDGKNEEDSVHQPEQLATGVLESILAGGELRMKHFVGNRVQLNQFHNLSEPELHYLINRHQRKYESIGPVLIESKEKKTESRRMLLKGQHRTSCCDAHECRIIDGDWIVELVQDAARWRITRIFVEGVEF
jgi:hypothetical protein